MSEFIVIWLNSSGYQEIMRIKTNSPMKVLNYDTILIEGDSFNFPARIESVTLKSGKSDFKKLYSYSDKLPMKI